MNMRPASVADFAALYGGVPDGEHEVLACVHDGRLVGLFGIADVDDELRASAWISEEMKRHPRWIVRGVRALRNLMDGRRVFAEANPDEPTADSLLRHVGFVEKGGRYVWRAGA